MISPYATARAAEQGKLCAVLLAEPPGLLDLLGDRSDALHVLSLERYAGDAKRDRERRKGCA